MGPSRTPLVSEGLIYDLSDHLTYFKRERDGKGETEGTMDNQSSRVVGSKGTSAREGDKCNRGSISEQNFRHIECEFDVLSLNTADIGDSF